MKLKLLKSGIHTNNEMYFWGGVCLFLLCYFMMFLDLSNIITVLIGTMICLILQLRQKKLKIDIGTCLITLTIISYFIIRYGAEKAIFMGLPYVGVLMYVLGNCLAYEMKTKENKEKLLFILFFMVVLGYTIHGFLNSYMYLAGYRTAAGREQR